MKPKVLVTRRLPAAVMEYLAAHFEITFNPPEGELPRDEFLNLVSGIDGLLPLISDRIDQEAMDHAGPKLKIIASYAVGFNNIDLKTATARKIAVCNTAGSLTETTADLTMALLSCVARRIVEGDAYVRSGKFKGWSLSLFVGADVHHKIIGLVGFGRIGRAVAKRAAGFDMRILYNSRHRADPEIENQFQAQYRDKETLLKESDFVSLHVPLTPETFHLIGHKEFSLMKPTSFIINTARGEVIDEHALVAALKNKSIAGAALDVYEHEPEIQPDLLSMDNVVLMPHIGSATQETRIKMGLMAVENLVAFFKGQIPPNCLNPEIFS